jgi:hypothetical protein
LLDCKDGKGWNKFIVSDGFVFRANKLYIASSFVCLLLLQEAHGDGLMRHFRAKKIHDILFCSFLLAKDEKRCGVVCCLLHNMPKGKS